MRWCAAAVLVFGCFGALATEGPPVGANCALEAPPENAGEDLRNGVLMRVFPRVRNISKDYSGCQMVWAPDAGKWVLSQRVQIEQGDPIRVWVPAEADPAKAACRYQEGKLVQGDRQVCPLPEFLLVKSMRAGCVERSKSEGKVAEGCNYE
ncbi:MAG: hypothetical protein KIT73_15550 [Burkholderiales bacterium]|nr:hypothetical protein [Burkholderiales bacterium]